jgi:hypothetical protein
MFVQLDCCNVLGHHVEDREETRRRESSSGCLEQEASNPLHLQRSTAEMVRAAS